VGVKTDHDHLVLNRTKAVSAEVPRGGQLIATIHLRSIPAKMVVESARTREAIGRKIIIGVGLIERNGVERLLAIDVDLGLRQVTDKTTINETIAEINTIGMNMVHATVTRKTAKILLSTRKV
jgi:hypothetical protein